VISRFPGAFTLLLSLSLFLFIYLLLSGAAAGEVLYVDENGEGDYESIQDAVDAAQDGDIIVVLPGTYSENVDIHRQVTLLGSEFSNEGGESSEGTEGDEGNDANGENENGEERTIIRKGTGTLLTITSANVTVKGFILDDGGYKKSGLRIEGSGILISNVTCIENYYGITIEGSHTIELRNIQCINYSRTGIDIMDSQDIRLDNLFCSGGEGGGGGDTGVNIEASTDISIIDGVITDNDDHGVKLVDSTNGVFRYCTFEYAKKGISLEGDSLNNTVEFSNFPDSLEYGIFGTGIDAPLNWWEDASGPYSILNDYIGTGTVISDDTPFEPWLVSTFSHATYRDRIAGYVLTIQLEPIRGAKVLVESPSGHRMTYTNGYGYYSISNLHIGNESRAIVVTSDGYEPHEAEIYVENYLEYNITLMRADIGTFMGSSSSPIPPASMLLGSILVLFSIILFTGDRRYALMTTLTAPLYTKLNKGEILSHDTRSEIYTYLTENPGSNYVQLRSDLQLGSSSMVHHLRVLEREGLINSRKELGRRLFFPRGSPLDPYHGSASLQPSGIQNQILTYLQNNETATSGEIRSALPLKRSTIHYSLSRLQERGLISCRKSGNRRYYSLAAGNPIHEDW